MDAAARLPKLVQNRHRRMMSVRIDGRCAGKPLWPPGLLRAMPAKRQSHQMGSPKRRPPGILVDIHSGRRLDGFEAR